MNEVNDNRNCDLTLRCYRCSDNKPEGVSSASGDPGSLDCDDVFDWM